ncbi:MAG TPA: DinB family protein [Longimicrobium sp.]|jgi:uncharacterized damage-inducible protein DinB
MHPVAAPLAAALGMHTRLYLNCLEGVDDEEAGRRPGERTNSLAFLALHLVDSRHFAARLLGVETVANPFAALLEGVSGIDGLARLPPLAEIRTAWSEVSAALEARLGALTADELGAPSPQRFPLDDPSVAGALAFLVTHDAYHVGQMALIRKYLGHAPMRYT